MAFDFYQEYPVNKDEKKKLAEKEKKEFKMSMDRLATTTNPFVPKQLEEFGKMLNTGMKNFEVGTLDLKNLESIPDEHLKEIRRLSNITNTKVSLHGPIMDWTGFNERGKWSEQTRKESERKMVSVIKRADILNEGKKGNIPVIFHASHQAFADFYDKNYDTKENRKKLLEDLEFLRKEAEKNAKRAREQNDLETARDQEAMAKSYQTNKEKFENNKLKFVRALGIINQDTGDCTGIEVEEKNVILPDGTSKKIILDPYSRLDEYNRRVWAKEKLNFNQLQQQEDQINRRIEQESQQVLKIREGLENLEQNPEYKRLDEESKKQEKANLERLYDITKKKINEETKVWQDHIRIIRRDRENLSSEIADKFFKLADEKQKEEFRKVAKTNNERIEQLRSNLNQELKRTKDDYEKNLLINEFESRKADLEFNTLGAMSAPKIFKPIEDFAQDKFSNTVSNVLAEFVKSKNFANPDDLPMMCIENWSPSTPMSHGDTLKQGLLTARKKFVDLIKDDPKFKEKFKENREKKAEEFAQKLIGATWDMGHINQLRQSGYEGRELQEKVIAETQKIADMVKHVHITDNFGFEDSHLAAGMGNVPIREVLETLEKKGFKGRGILESGGVINSLGIQPHHIDLEFFHVPIFENRQEKNDLRSIRPPYWSAEYPNFYKDTFIEYPSQHFGMYGSGFSTLPKSLGGDVGAGASRFSNTPNQ